MRRSMMVGMALSTACAATPDARLLALGGLHALDGTVHCQLRNAAPADAFEDLHWHNALVVRARAEGTAELVCGEHVARLRIVKPDRVDIVVLAERVTVAQQFEAKAVPRAANKELEIGKWTHVAWHGDATMVIVNDRSAGEFGLCPTCFGIQSFLAAGPTGTIEVRLGELLGTRTVSTRP